MPGERVKVEPTAIPDVKLVQLVRHGDHRGFVVETYRRSALREAGIDVDFVQDNHTFSATAGTVRGLHFQTPPAAQGKLIRAVRGAILDVAVDIRHGSPTFGRHVAVRLTAEDPQQLWIPPGFAHGFCTLEPATEVAYKASAYYSPEHDRGLAWDDPALGIAWPVSDAEATLSDRDRRWPTLAELPVCFEVAALEAAR